MALAGPATPGSTGPPGRGGRDVGLASADRPGRQRGLGVEQQPLALGWAQHVHRELGVEERPLTVGPGPSSAPDAGVRAREQPLQRERSARPRPGRRRAHPHQARPGRRPRPRRPSATRRRRGSRRPTRREVAGLAVLGHLRWRQPRRRQPVGRVGNSHAAPVATRRSRATSYSSAATSCTDLPGRTTSADDRHRSHRDRAEQVHREPADDRPAAAVRRSIARASSAAGGPPCWLSGPHGEIVVGQWLERLATVVAAGPPERRNRRSQAISRSCEPLCILLGRCPFSSVGRASPW